MVGGTRELAAAVWVGREKVNKKTKQMDLLPIYKPGGKPMNGGSIPGDIWKMFLDSASKELKGDVKPFLPNSTAFVDSSKKGNGIPPPPKLELPDNPACLVFPQQCQDGNNGNNGNSGPGNGNGNNGNNTPTLPGFPTFPGNDTGTGGGQDDADDGN